MISTAASHARVRGSVPGLGGLKETKMFLPHPRVKVSIAGSLRDREVACSASDRQGSNFESCVWRTVSSQSSHHPQEVLLAQFSLYMHKGGLKPDSFIFFPSHIIRLRRAGLACLVSHHCLLSSYHNASSSTETNNIFTLSLVSISCVWSTSCMWLFIHLKIEMTISFHNGLCCPRPNPLTAKLFYFNFLPLEVVSRWRDAQPQVSENYSDLTKWRSTVFIYSWFMSLFFHIFNMFRR